MRLIDADALIKYNGLESATKYGNRSAKQRTNSYSTMMLYEIADMIDEAPTIDAAPVKHGRWLKTNDDTMKRCSECDVIHLIAQYPHGNANYCPNCGAKMDGDEKND